MVCLARLRPFNVIQSQRLPPKRSKTKWYHYIQDLSVMYFNTVLCKFRPNIPHSWSLDCSSFESLIFFEPIASAYGQRKALKHARSGIFLTSQRFFCLAPRAQFLPIRTSQPVKNIYIYILVSFGESDQSPWSGVRQKGIILFAFLRWPLSLWSREQALRSQMN